MTHLVGPLVATTFVDALTFTVAAAIVLAGAVGVVVARNPVHSALMLVMTLFGVAVLFVEQQADFLAAVQVIVYAGAIIVLFLFVIMLLGVDRREVFGRENLRGQRPMAAILVVLGLAGIFLLGFGAHWATGAPSVAGRANAAGPNVAKLGTSVFTTYLLPFEATAALLVIAVVGAVVLVRRTPGARGPDDQDDAGLEEHPGADGGDGTLAFGTGGEASGDADDGDGGERGDLGHDDPALGSTHERKMTS